MLALICVFGVLLILALTVEHYAETFVEDNWSVPPVRDSWKLVGDVAHLVKFVSLVGLCGTPIFNYWFF